MSNATSIEVAAAMERQDLARPWCRSARSRPVAGPRGRRRAPARGARQRLVHGLVVGLAGADQSRLGDENALRVALQTRGTASLGRSRPVLGERHERDDAADGIDFRRVQIGLDRDLLARRPVAGGARCARWHARRGRGRRGRRRRRRHDPCRCRGGASSSAAGADLRRDRRRRRVLRLPRVPQEERGKRRRSRTG